MSSGPVGPLCPLRLKLLQQSPRRRLLGPTASTATVTVVLQSYRMLGGGVDVAAAADVRLQSQCVRQRFD